MVTLSIRMPQDLYDTLTDIAASDDRSLNYTVRRLLAQSVGATGTRPAETASGFRAGQDRPALHGDQPAS